MSSEHQWLLEATGMAGNPIELAKLAEQLKAAGDVHIAATAIDRAFALVPDNAAIRQARMQLLDQLSLKEHGIVFRYIPAGTFMMGFEHGDADEAPVHPVQLDHFWIAETPVSWATYCRLMDWEAPPVGTPKGSPTKGNGLDRTVFQFAQANKIRLQYCEDETERARDWHAHMPAHNWKKRTGEAVSCRTLFGEPQRGDPSRPWGYEAKPMVCVGWESAEELCIKLSKPTANQPGPGFIASLLGRGAGSASKTRFRLPTEAEWEKAARGGLIGCRYPWGDELPTQACCDFGRFDQFSILQMKRFSANDYGLYAMSGGVWEWTNDWYDAEFYAQSPSENPRGPAEGKKKVVRGGSWADCAEAVTVSFRMSMGGDGPPVAANPNIGFRLCRVE